MKYYGGNVPPSPSYVAHTHHDHWRAWEFRRQLALPLPPLPVAQIPQEIVDQLTDRAPEPVIPEPHELVSQIPDVVMWCRAQMSERSTDWKDKTSGAEKPGSRPPFRVAYMAAADREFAALAHWAALYGIKTEHPVWRTPDKHGRLRITGLAVDSYDALYDLADRLWEVLADTYQRDDYYPEGILDDPRWGLWKIRQQHYAIWPQLQLKFVTKAEAVPERADLDDTPPEQEEALF